MGRRPEQPASLVTVDTDCAYPDDMWMNRHPASKTPWTTGPDDDLTWDLLGVTISDLLVLDREVFFAYQSEVGWWTDDSGEHRGPTIGLDGHLSMTIGPAVAPDDTFSDYVQQLWEWMTDREPLRFVAAPQKMACLFDAYGVALPIPILN